MSHPLFSVIVPTYNRERRLSKCVTSVIEQTYSDTEIIIVDDGSSDGTRGLIDSFNDRRIRYVFQDNRGPACARNRGMELAASEFIAFLDSDDWWDHEKLERSLTYIKKYPDIKIFHTEEIWYRNGRLLSQRQKHKKPTGMVYKSALPICCISISTAVVHKDVFSSIGPFDESMEACEDYDFWLRATAKYEVKLIPEALTSKDGGRADQLSSSVWGLDRFRIKALEKMLSSPALSGEYRDLTLKELKKKCAIFAAGCVKRGKSREAEYYLSLHGKFE